MQVIDFNVFEPLHSFTVSVATRSFFGKLLILCWFQAPQFHSRFFATGRGVGVGGEEGGGGGIGRYGPATSLTF